MPQLFWPVDDHKPDYVRGSKSADAKSRPPLEVPPELRREVEVPMPDAVAAKAARGDAGLSEQEKAAVAGKAVSLDARLYPNAPAEVFSAALDAMTALNLPVQSVDSPSGTITTTWVRPDSNSPNSYLAAALNVVGAGPTYTRYRFVIRILRAKQQTMLQVRTLGQQFINRHWVNKPIQRKVSNEIFSAVEERLSKPSKSAAPARIGSKSPEPRSTQGFAK